MRRSSCTIDAIVVVRVRAERRRQLRTGLSERAALVDAFIAVHRETDLFPTPAPVPIIEAPKAPPLKRYYNE
jgi:hypothetical protein